MPRLRFYNKVRLSEGKSHTYSRSVRKLSFCRYPHYCNAIIHPRSCLSLLPRSGFKLDVRARLPSTLQPQTSAVGECLCGRFGLLSCVWETCSISKACLVRRLLQQNPSNASGYNDLGNVLQNIFDAHPSGDDVRDAETLYKNDIENTNPQENLQNKQHHGQ